MAFIGVLCYVKTRTPPSWLVSSKFAAITIIKVNNKALRRCEDAMVHAADYAAWKEAAREHDRLSGCRRLAGADRIRPSTITG